MDHRDFQAQAARRRCSLSSVDPYTHLRMSALWQDRHFIRLDVQAGEVTAAAQVQLGQRDTSEQIMGKSC